MRCSNLSESGCHNSTIDSAFMEANPHSADSVDIYEADYVRQLFDEMSESYDRVNYLTSFGFSQRWRRQCVEHALIQSGETVHDLMCGMGECWGYMRSVSQLSRHAPNPSPGRTHRRVPRILLWLRHRSDGRQTINLTKDW